MTRGIILYISDNACIWKTEELSHDMSPDGYGDEIIYVFQEGLFKNVHSFEKYLRRFINRSFYECKDEDPILQTSYLDKERTMDISKNWTDYLYVINESDDIITIHSKGEKTSLKSGCMAVIYFQSVESILEKNIQEKPE